MKKVFLLPAFLGLASLSGCVSQGAYKDLAERVKNEQDLNTAMKQEMVQLGKHLKELQTANVDLANALQASDQSTHQEVKVEEEIDSMLAEWSTQLESNLFSDFEVLQADHAMGVRLDDGKDVLFASGKWALTQKAKQSLDVLSEIIIETLKNHPSYVVRVDGHTDNDPIRSLKKQGIQDNTHLAFMRANAVRRYLVDKGIDKDDVYVMAAGEWIPVSEQKKLNRRVEIWVSTPAGFSLPNQNKNQAVIARTR